MGMAMGMGTTMRVGKTNPLTCVGSPCVKCGGTIRYKKSKQCKKCVNLRTTTWKNEHYIDGAGYIATWRKNNPLQSMIINARYKAKKKGVVFTLTVKDVHLPEECPCCGDVLVFFPGKSGHLPSSPSFDRLDPQKGYVPGNVNIICWACNSVKTDATVERIEAVARWMRSQGCA